MSDNQYSEEYLKFAAWVRENMPNTLPFTRSQQEFIEWTLKDENKVHIGKIGNLTDAFIVSRQYIKHS